MTAVTIERSLSSDLPRISEESDETLMVRLMGGQDAAFEALHDRYAGRIHNFIGRFVGDRQWAEDLTQEVFLKLYRNPSAFDPRKRFLTWIFAVARNACIDFLRLKKLPVLPMSPGEDGERSVLEPEAGARHDPVERAASTELDERVQQVVNTLSPKLREVFVLCAVQGLSYEDAAEIIGCPVKTVSSRLSRARERFYLRFERFLGPFGSESS